nr:hypothetical protein [Candidatus Sigynarchaeota archaeon]
MPTINNVKLEPCYQGHREMLGIPLNPADASNNNGHYFSGQQSQYHWDLYRRSDLIIKEIKKVSIDDAGNKVYADDVFFRGNSINRKG